jgi:hypothetical protein
MKGKREGGIRTKGMERKDEGEGRRVREGERIVSEQWRI